MATATQRAEDVDVIQGADEVSLSQKMLSAVSGSILTSLLGKPTLHLSISSLAQHRPAVSTTVFPATSSWTLSLTSNSHTSRCRSRPSAIARNPTKSVFTYTARIQWLHADAVPRHATEHRNLGLLPREIGRAHV